MSAERWLLAAMVASIALVAAAMALDESRQFEQSVQALMESQVAVALAVGADFEARLSRYEQDTGKTADETMMGPRVAQFLAGATALEQNGMRQIWIAAPGSERLMRTGSHSVRSPALSRAIASGANSKLLTRSEAHALGLPDRLAVAGLDRMQGRGGQWAVAVVASGQRLRAREQHAQLRFMLGIGATIAIVLGFGGMALRQQWRRLEVARELEVSALLREREKLLARADKLATVAALSSGIAHEVATPLGTIMARVEQAMPAVEHAPKAAAALGVVLDQVDRIHKIIRGVLGLVRGEMPPFVHAEVARIARTAMSLVQHRFGEAGVSLQLDAPGELPPIACNPAMLEQALVNLLLNACDASERDHVVHIRVRAEAGRISFVVEDEGEGIAKENAERVREPFFTTKSEGRGTGLGLAIAREIVSHHGGKLSLEQRDPQRGTRAVIELPQA